MRLSLKPNVSSGNCSIVTLFINFMVYISTEYCDFCRNELRFRQKRKTFFSAAIFNLGSALNPFDIEHFQSIVDTTSYLSVYSHIDFFIAVELLQVSSTVLKVS